MSNPANLNFEYQDQNSRLWALLTIFPIKNFLLIPHFIIIAILGFITFFIGIIGLFAVLIKGEFPKSFEVYIINLYRRQWHITSYLSCMTAKYPPFSHSKKSEYPAKLSFEHQKTSSRLWAFLTLISVKMILLIPHFIILFVMQIVMAISMFLGILAVIIFGKHPRAFHKVIVKTQEYMFRINVYIFCLTDKYPGFPWQNKSQSGHGLSPQEHLSKSINAGENV